MSKKKEKIYPIAAGPSPDKKGKQAAVSWKITVLQLFLAIFAVTATVFVVSQLFCSYGHDYITEEPLTNATNENSELNIDPIDESEAPPPPKIPVIYDFSSVIPESGAVAYSYFDDTVFIGDSRTKGLIDYSQLSPYDFSSVGLNVSLLLEKAFLRFPDENGELQPHTLLEALEREDVNFKSIYIATGLNELGWPVEGFIPEFSKLIDTLREATDVPIYVQTIIPVTTYSSETTLYGITNEKCVIFNEQLIKLVKEKEVFLLDPRELFTLEDGTLDPAHSSDGVHLNRDSCKILADYYRTHVVNIYAYDNTRPTE